jgi:hypothetical protein
MGRDGPVQLGSGPSPGDGPGLLGAAIFMAIFLKDRVTIRSHPNKAVDVVPAKTSRYLFGLRVVNACLPLTSYLTSRERLL